MNTAGEDGPSVSSGSAVLMSSGWLLDEPPRAAARNVTGVDLCPLPGRAAQQRGVEAREMLDVLWSVPVEGAGGEFCREQRGNSSDVSWGLGVALSFCFGHWRRGGTGTALASRHLQLPSGKNGCFMTKMNYGELLVVPDLR